ncbi:hypothetical protein [Sphingomonas sp.]|uniref:hypothetical protein n=1 Tax=Sphingomonas sp. TaxID=28214 RepID=UPI0035C84498
MYFFLHITGSNALTRAFLVLRRASYCAYSTVNGSTMMRSILAGAAALSLIATPTIAAAAPASSNPAASLSVSNARAATATSKKSQLAGAGFFAAAILAGIAAIGVIAIVNDSDDSDSN